MCARVNLQCVCVCDKGREPETEREEEIKREIGIREREEMRGWKKEGREVAGNKAPHQSGK